MWPGFKSWMRNQNCKGPQTISAANVGSIKDLISPKNVKTNDRLQGCCYVKNVSRHQHDKNRYSRIATVDSCFSLLGSRQHCVAKICNASKRVACEKAHSASGEERILSASDAGASVTGEAARKFSAPPHQTPPRRIASLLNSLFAARACAPKCEPARRLAKEPTYINCKVTHSLYQVPYFELTFARNTRCHITCFGAQEDRSVTIGVSKAKNKCGWTRPA